MDKKSGLLYISISVMVVVVIVLGVILTLDREEPNIYVQTEVNQKDIYWNLQTPIRVEVADKSKLKSFETILIADQKEYVLENELVNEDSNSGILTFEIKPFKATDSTIFVLDLYIYAGAYQRRQVQEYFLLFLK